MYHLWPNISDPSNLKRDHITYQFKGSVGGGGGAGRQGMVWGFDIFPKFVVKLPAHRQIIPVKCTKISLSFIRVATVREKQKFFKVREKSGNFLKSQGTLFCGTMHQGWQWAFKGKIKHL